jgi:hypothetical protein
MKKLFFCIGWICLVLLISSLVACESMGDIAEILLGVSQGVSDGLNSTNSSSSSSSNSSRNSSNYNTYTFYLYNYSSVPITVHGDGKTYKISPNTYRTHSSEKSYITWYCEQGYLDVYVDGFNVMYTD